MEPVRIVIASRQRVFAEAMASELGRRPNMRVLGCTESALRTYELIDEDQVDLVLIEVATPELRAFEMMRRFDVEDSGIKFLALAGPKHCELLVRAVRSGAEGYVLSVSPLTRLIEAIEKVSAGERYFDEALFAHLGRENPGDTDSIAVDALTVRQRDILKQIAQGFSTKEIGLRLDISPKTVESHRFRIMQKLGIRRVAGLVQFSVREGLIEA
jgi:DNA-binding NarL/FixJ family response regulator